MYHRFPERHRESFDRQCEFLATNYTVVSLAEAIGRLDRKEPVDNLAVITVDDGYSDMYEVAFPILQRYNLPATLFVTTGLIDRTCWMAGDRVRYHFARTQDETVSVADDAGEVHSFSTRDGQGSDALRALLKRVPNRTRSRLLAELEGGESPPESVSESVEYRPCTWEQLGEMADGGVSLGAHTVNHPILSRVETEQETHWEILQSKAALEDKLKRSVDMFAYPNGLPEDMSVVSVDCVREHFRGAVTAIFGLNAPGADVHQLVRLPCHPDMPVPQMARMMAGPLLRSAATLHGSSEPIHSSLLETGL